MQALSQLSYGPEKPSAVSHQPSARRIQTHADRRDRPADRRGKWAGPELNRRRTDFQSVALPPELPALKSFLSRHLQAGWPRPRSILKSSINRRLRRPRKLRRRVGFVKCVRARPVVRDRARVYGRSFAHDWAVRAHRTKAEQFVQVEVALPHTSNQPGNSPGDTPMSRMLHARIGSRPSAWAASINSSLSLPGFKKTSRG